MYPYLKSSGMNALLCLLVSLCTVWNMNAQRSLYKDAMALSEAMTKELPILRVDLNFQQPDSVWVSYYISDTEHFQVEDRNKSNTNCLMSHGVAVEFTLSGQLLAGDRLTIELPDSTVTVIYGEEKNVSGDWFVDVLYSNYEISIKENHVDHLYYTKVAEDPLGLLLNYDLAKQFKAGNTTSRYLSLQQAYGSNPFFDDELVGARFSTLDALFDFRSRLPDEAVFIENHYLGYPYEKIISGDSLLDFRQKLSLTTVTSSYRNQIVTAQQQLLDANTEINQQREKRGLLDVNTVAVGLSDFIAEKAQEELNLTFFNRFKENLKKDTELTKLFPETRKLLYKFEISNYKTFLAHARETFENDLDNLGLNLPRILDLPKYTSLKNEPNVFNLSLIYSIADLAYREEPVENILLASLQQTRQRTDYLDKSINLAIADSTLSQYLFVPEGTSPLLEYREELLDYTLNVKGVTEDYRAIEKLLTEKFAFSFISIYNEMDEQTIIEFFTVIQAVEKALEELNYQPQLLSGKRVVQQEFDPFDFSHNHLAATLTGNDYHAYRLGAGEITDFDSYYRLAPRDTLENMVNGVATSREFINQRFNDKFKAADTALGQLVDKIGFMQNEIIRLENQNTSDDQGEKLRFCEEKSKHLLSSIDQALQFWETTTGLDSLNHYLGGLRFLRNHLARIDLKELTQAVSDSTRKLVQEVAMTNERIDSIAAKYNFQRAKLVEVFGDRTSQVSALELKAVLNDSTLQLKQRDKKMKISLLRALVPDSELAAFTKIGEEEDEEKFVANALVSHLKEEKLVPSRLAAEALVQQHNRLDSMLKGLEREYAPKLIKARRNARNLSAVLELSTHLLFAFRNYDQVYDTLFYQDTQRVEVTLQLPKGKDGILSTYKQDSLTVFKRIVPGTTEKVTSARWVTNKEFTQLRKNKKAWNAFLGLLYQRLNSVENAPDISPEGVALIAVQFLELINEMSEQRNDLRRKRAANPKSISVRDYYPFIRSTVDLFNTVMTAPIVGEAGGSIANAESGLAMVPVISDEALSLYENIFVKNYGNAILNATELLKIITNQELPFQSESSGGIQYTSLSKAERKERSRNLRGINAVFRYGTFMSSMINAQSSDEVKAILKSTTLPPGSSRIKREVLSNITVNSYLGLAGGIDRLIDAPTGLNPKAIGAALSVPIGLTYSFSPAFLRNNSSFSIHVPLLDLGAITAYRSNPNGNTVNVNNLPELEWKNLFSPGAYFIYNFANSPVSIGFGGQYGPQLRELNQANGEPVFLNSFRIPMGFISVDVPFYNLHTGARKITVR